MVECKVMKIRLIYNSLSNFKFAKTTVVVVSLIEIEMVLHEVLARSEVRCWIHKVELICFNRNSGLILMRSP